MHKKNKLKKKNIKTVQVWYVICEHVSDIACDLHFKFWSTNRDKIARLSEELKLVMSVVLKTGLISARM